MSGREGESKRETQGNGRRKLRGEGESNNMEKKKDKKKMDEMIKVDGETTT